MLNLSIVIKPILYQVLLFRLFRKLAELHEVAVLLYVFYRVNAGVNSFYITMKGLFLAFEVEESGVVNSDSLGTVYVSMQMRVTICMLFL